MTFFRALTPAFTACSAAPSAALPFRFAARSISAAAGIACALFGGAAGAQTTVSLYGIVDQYVQVGRAGGTTTTRIESGGESGSRLGFRGQEDLGGGLRAFFILEHGLAADSGGTTQGGVFWGRQSYVGLAHASYGSFTLGRQYNLGFSAIDAFDPFSAGLGSVFSAGIVSAFGGARLNNSLVYVAPKLGPVTVSLQGAAGEAAIGKTVAADVRYASGPLVAGVTHVRRERFGALSEEGYSTLLAATVDFGVVKLFGEAQSVKNLTQAAATQDDRTEYSVGAQMPFGPHRISAVWGQGRTRQLANTKASAISLGYQYAMSKRTDLFAIATAIDNGSATAYTANGATGAGPITTAGQDVRAMQVGIRHRF